MAILTFIPRTPRLRRTNWRVHRTDVKNTNPTRGLPLSRVLVDKRSRGDGDWLRIALLRNVWVLCMLGGVGVWPKLRVVRRECRGIGVPIVRMIGVMFAVVELQKIGRIHEGESWEEDECTKEELRELFSTAWTERGEKVRARQCYYMCHRDVLWA